MTRNLFVAIEGIDGAGKSTAVDHLGRELGRLGLAVLRLKKQSPPVRSPYVAKHLALLREMLWRQRADAPVQILGELHWTHLHAAYLAALGTHVIDQEHAESPCVVLVDSWIGKLVARVATNGSWSISDLLRLLDDLRKPDAVVLLDVAPDVAAARRNDGHSPFESWSLTTSHATFDNYQRQVRANLLQMAEAGGWSVYPDRGQNPDQIAADLASLLVPILHEMRVNA